MQDYVHGSGQLVDYADHNIRWMSTYKLRLQNKERYIPIFGLG